MMHAKTSDESSQMKNESVVIALTDSNDKPYREYDFKKTHTPNGASSCKVYLPFDSEYKILVKNQNNCRIKIDAELDGTTITSSGLIIAANGVSYIERFISGDGRKFKFVTLLNEGVADPTAKENGILRIKVAKEKASEINKTIETRIHHHYDYWWNRNPWAPSPFGGVMYGNNNIHAYTSRTSDAIINHTKASRTLDGGAEVVSYNASLPSCDKLSFMDSAEGGGSPGKDVGGATVEGSVSNQKFETTFWNGDLGTIATFVFKLLGKEFSEEDKKELAEFERLKKKFG